MLSTRCTRTLRSSTSMLKPSRPLSTTGCPITGQQEKQEESSPPQLKEVPTLPFIGSLLTQYSGTPPLDPTKIYSYTRQMKQKFGEFYTSGLPGFGRGLHGTQYRMSDPTEFMKIVRLEGAYPSGIIENVWAFKNALKSFDSALMDENGDFGLLGRGERWKKHRTFLQTGMLCPKAARGFMPGIVKAAGMASRGASMPQNANNVNLFLNVCAIEMFSSFMFGELMGVSSSKSEQEEKGSGVRQEQCKQGENRRFCMSAVKAMDILHPLAISPYENVMNAFLGLETKQFKDFRQEWAMVRDIGRKKIHAFMDRYEKGELNDTEKASYLANAIQRQKEQDKDGVTKEEMIELCLFSLFAAVDTTSSLTAWILVHLALNPEVQTKLHQELSTHATSEETTDWSDVLTKAKSPYLHAVVRESLRMTPPFMAALFKSNSKAPVDIHGITIPKDSMVWLANLNDADYVPHPDTFQPERWLSGAVSARKGTPAEVMDHAALRDPFGQGARRCPGSRVASNEVLALVSQLVLDWEIVFEGVEGLEEVRYGSSPIKPYLDEMVFEARA